MVILFGVFWLIASIAMGLLIQGDILKSKRFHKIGLTLIILSFIGGLSMLAAVVVSI